MYTLISIGAPLLDRLLTLPEKNCLRIKQAKEQTIQVRAHPSVAHYSVLLKRVGS
jgi:hypothetical protein